MLEMLVDSFEISGELSFINNVNAKVIVKIVQSMSNLKSFGDLYLTKMKKKHNIEY